MKLLIVFLFIGLQLTNAKFMFRADANWGTDLSYDYSIYSHLPKTINNIDYLGRGYNIFYGNPHSTQGLDPGYTNYHILDLQYSSNFNENLNSDLRFYVPPTVRINALKSCSTSYSSKQIESMTKYQESLSVSVSVEGNFAVASFSASSDYKQLNEQMSKQESLFIESKAECAIFDLAFYTNKQGQPQINQYLFQYFDELEKKGDDASAYHDFFDTYGTHVVVKVKLGSTFGYRFELKSDSASKMSSQGFSLEASASAFCFSGSFGIDKQNSSVNEFKNNMKSWKQFTVGALPDPDNDVSKWATQTIDNPMPISNYLYSMDKVIDVFTQKDAIGLTATQITNLKNRFAKFAENYCQNRLFVQGKVSSCAASKVALNVVSTVETFKTDFDKLTKNGKLPIVIQNLKSSLFYRAVASGSNLYIEQAYYNNGKQFQFTFTRIDQNKNYYQVKSVSQENKCLASEGCQINNDRLLNLQPCANALCQQWEVILFDAKVQSYKLRNLNSNKVMIIFGRHEHQGEFAAQYEDHNCENCNLFFFHLPF